VRLLITDRIVVSNCATTNGDLTFVQGS
jgi:hypothetical protein